MFLRFLLTNDNGWIKLRAGKDKNMQYVFDDGGREKAGYTGKCGDCVVRAIAIVTGRDYAAVYKEIAALNCDMSQTRRRRTVGRKTAREGIYTDSILFKRYIESMGFQWLSTMRIGEGCKVHLREDELPFGRLIVKVSKHLTAVIDRVIHDTFDPSRGGQRCVYGYWTANFRLI